MLPKGCHQAHLRARALCSRTRVSSGGAGLRVEDGAGLTGTSARFPSCAPPLAGLALHPRSVWGGWPRALPLEPDLGGGVACIDTPFLPESCFPVRGVCGRAVQTFCSLSLKVSLFICTHLPVINVLK